MDKTKEILEQFRRIHGNKYDYSMVEYKNKKSKVKIICPIHGEFEQAPRCHLNGSGCMKCKYEQMRMDFTTSVLQRIEQFRKIHGDKYDYSLFENGSHKDKKIPIICRKHGTFYQTLGSHLNGHGCPECGRERSTHAVVSTRNEFIDNAIIVHGGKYDYSKVDYVNNKTKVKIICPIHGEFEQIPNSHLGGKGCISCSVSISSGHQELIDMLCGYNLSINNRELLNPYEIDIYLPSYNLAIEFNGNYWHSYGAPESTHQRNKHKLKHQICVEKGINMLQISEYDWIGNKNIVKSIINHKLGTSNRVYARDCDIIQVDNESSKAFVNENHLYGYKRADLIYALVYGGRIFSIMSFNRHAKHGWEINRYASLIGHVVVGGAGKLFTRFLREMNPEEVLTYADARYGTGEIYRTLGFELVAHTPPNYKYFKSNRMYSRQSFQKHKLPKKLDHFDEALTEAENMFANGYRRLWDSGHYKFLWSGK